jgi:hypothetical protein
MPEEVTTSAGAVSVFELGERFSAFVSLAESDVDLPQETKNAATANVANTLIRSSAPFPLTRALSVGEKENRFSGCESTGTLVLPRRGIMRLPLPEGEGWDEEEHGAGLAEAILRSLKTII